MKLEDKFFTLPPPNKRKMIEGRLRSGFFGASTPEQNDTYIYYLCFKWTFLIGVFLALVNIILVNFHLPPYETPAQANLETTSSAYTFLKTYPIYMTAVTWLIILPYFCRLFKVNVNKETFDPYWWRPKDYMVDAKQQQSRHVFQMIVGIAMIPCTGIALISIGKYLGIIDSHFYFLAAMVVTPLVMAHFSHVFLIATTTLDHLERILKT